MKSIVFMNFKNTPAYVLGKIKMFKIPITTKTKKTSYININLVAMCTKNLLNNVTNTNFKLIKYNKLIFNEKVSGLFSNYKYFFLIERMTRVDIDQA